ncbi:MAG: hypothetical protein DA408_12460 [Bacteroidetes bacterium]|nr:MAG: hypothetical protein C7N36_05935 [Bacteroidota bacterium]PTM11843.1 MAG: hypothetical protein DA408_12460 [Bacteroidota bacterium]
MKHIILFLFLSLGLAVVQAQVILTPLSSPETMVACGEPASYTLSVINAGSNGYGNLILRVQLPTGMEYVPGSIQGFAQEFDLSDRSFPRFRFPDLMALSTQEISFSTIINCSFSNDAGVNYAMTVNGSDVTATEQPLANYAFPEVVITAIDFPVLNLAVATTANRTFTIIQSTPGARLDTLFFLNRYDPGMASLGLNLGTLLGSGPGVDTFFLTGNELPGGDLTFDFGDTLRLTERVRLLDCAPANSTIELFWRCGEELCQRFVTNTLLTQATGTTDLRIRNTSGFASQTVASNPSLVGGGFCDTLHLNYLLENRGEENAPGAGAIYDLILGLGLNNNLFSNTEPVNQTIFPNWRIRVTIAGNPIDLGLFQFPNPAPLLGYNLRFGQLTSDPDGAGGLADVDGDGFFDDLPVGNSTTVEVHIIYDPYATTDCAFLSGYPYNGGAETNLRVGYYYRDQCEQVRSYWYSVNDPGINVVSLFTHRTITYSVELAENNLNPGQVTTLEIRPDGAWNSPCSATDSIVLEIILPDGLVAENTAYGPGQFYGIVERNGDTIRLASTERGTFTQPWGLSVSLDCGEAIVDTTINLSFLYFCSPGCSPPKRIDCQEIVMDYLPQCQPCLEGIDTRKFSAERINLGWTNAAHTARVDPALDPTINLGAAIDFDSVALRLQGVFRGNGPYDELFARVTYQGMNPSFADPTLPFFEPVGTTLEYFAADGFSATCTGAPVTLTYNTSTGEHQLVAALEAFFGPGGCLENHQRRAGDSLVFSIYSLVTTNTPRRALPIPELTGQLYLVRNGQEISCNQYLDNFVLEQVIPNVNLGYSNQEHYGCGAIYFNNNSIANPGHIYDADQFPNEVRSIVDVAEVRIYLEGNWQLQPGSSDLLANGSFDENDAVSSTAPYVIVPLPDPLVAFDGTTTLFTYRNPGDWPAGDLVIGGSNPVHNIRFRAVPGCLVPNGTPFGIAMEADMIRYLNAPADRRDTITSRQTNTSKTLLQPTANLLLASPQEFIPNSDTVSWELRVNNNTSYGNADKLIRHAWLAIEANPAVTIFAIEEVTNPNNPVALPLLNYSSGENYWVRLGNVAAFSGRNFRIRGRYTGCERQELTAKLGYSCVDYPNPDPGAGYQLAGTFFSCANRTLSLYIQPTAVSLSMVVTGPPLPAPLCEELDYRVLVSNLQLPTAYGNALRVDLPLGAEVVAGSSLLESPAGSGNWRPLNDPQLLGNNAYTWALANDPNGLTRLAGVDRAPNNTYQLAFKLLTRCGLNAGLRLEFQAQAVNSCGQIEEKTAFSERLLIAGLPSITNNYALFLGMPDNGLQACDNSRIAAKLVNLGPLATSDLEFAVLTLPRAFGFVDGSSIGPTALVAQTEQFGARLLQFQLPAGVPPGDSIVFSFQVADLGEELLDCTTAEISLAAVLQNQVACRLSPQDSCNILLVLQSDTSSVAQQKDRLDFSLVDHQSVNLGNTAEQITTHLRLTNLDNRPARTDSLVWEVYLDQNNNGQLDPGTDVLLYTSPERPLNLAAGGSWLDRITYVVPSDQSCQLLVTYRNPGYSCQCEPARVVALPTPALRNAGPDQTLCSGDTVWLGTDERLGNITYQWQPQSINLPGTIGQPDSAFTTLTLTNTGLATATYGMLLTTNRGGQCLSTDTVAVTVRPALRPTIAVATDYTGQDISCRGAIDGGLSLSVALASPPLTYQQGNLPAQTSPLFSNLSAGMYEFTATDAAGCRTTIAGTLTEPDSLAIGINSSQPVSCYGGNDGQLAVQPTGGTPDYAYQWSNGPGGTPTIVNLTSGWYQLTVSDANGCQLVSDSLFVAQAPQLVYTLAIDSTRCSYSADGLAQVDSLYGGTAPLTFSWEDGTTATSNPNLLAGDHLLRILDGAGCLVAIPFRIPAPPPLAIDLATQTAVSCYGGQDGNLEVSATGGHAPYDFSWSHGAADENVQNLPAGSYRVNLLDQYGCSLQSPTYTITQPDSLTISDLLIEPISCFGAADGSITVAAAGGTAPYAFLWHNGEDGPHLDHLPADNYTLVISDTNGCTYPRTIRLTEPTLLTSSVEQIAPNCFGDNGYFIFEPAGGTPPYRYSVDEGASFSTEAEQAVRPGTYALVVADQNGCQNTDSLTLVEPPPIRIETPTELVLNYGDTAQISTWVYNIRGDSIVSWRPDNGYLSCVDCLQPIVRPLETTVYYLRVSDAFGCYDEVRIPVIVERPRRVFLPTAFSPNGDGNNDLFFPNGAREVALIRRLEIYNRWGSLVFERRNFPPNDPAQGWDGTFNGQELPAAAYAYFIEIGFTDGTVITYVGDVVLVR